jgi:hypothetical protein
MVRLKTAIKILGLCLAIFALASVIANITGAETGSKWTLIDSTGHLIETSFFLNPGYTWESEGGLTFLTEVSKKLIAISCTGLTAEGSTFQVEGKLSEGTSTLTGCTTKIGGALSSPCKPHSEGAAEGTIKSLPWHGLIKLHSGALVILILRSSLGSILWDIIFGPLGESECAIGESLPISGHLSLKDCSNALTTHQVKHLMAEFPGLTELWALNKTAEHKVVIDGSFWMYMIGVHAGLKWAGLA